MPKNMYLLEKTIKNVNRHSIKGSALRPPRCYFRLVLMSTSLALNVFYYFEKSEVGAQIKNLMRKRKLHNQKF